eukprot:COSAG02_NODE_2624_length_8398_cov_18.889505_2_plen_1247_part_00
MDHSDPLRIPGVTNPVESTRGTHQGTFEIRSSGPQSNEWHQHRVDAGLAQGALPDRGSEGLLLPGPSGQEMPRPRASSAEEGTPPDAASASEVLATGPATAGGELVDVAVAGRVDSAPHAQEEPAGDVQRISVAHMWEPDPDPDLDLDEDPELATRPAGGELPPGWDTRTSRSTGEEYYVNLITEESTYERPTASALPEGWTHGISRSTGYLYFVSPSGESTYESPWGVKCQKQPTGGGIKSFGGGLLSMSKAKAEQAAKLTAERADQAAKIAEDKARQAQMAAKDSSPKLLASVHAAGGTARSKGLGAVSEARRKMAEAAGSTIGVRRASSPPPRSQCGLEPEPVVAADCSQYNSSSTADMTQQTSAAVAPISEPEIQTALRGDRPAPASTPSPEAGGAVAGGGGGGLLSKGRAKAKQVAKVTAEKAEQAAKLAEEKTKQAQAEARRKVDQQRQARASVRPEPGERGGSAIINLPGQWDVMISYTQRNPMSEALAAHLHGELMRRGRTCWLDVKMPRRDEAAMEEGVKGARCVIAIVSGVENGQQGTAYFERPFCLRELRWAMEAEVLIQPVVVAEDKGKITEFVEMIPQDLHHLTRLNWNHLDHKDQRFFELGVTIILEAAGLDQAGADAADPVNFTAEDQLKNGKLQRTSSTAAEIKFTSEDDGQERKFSGVGSAADLDVAFDGMFGPVTKVEEMKDGRRSGNFFVVKKMFKFNIDTGTAWGEESPTPGARMDNPSLEMQILRDLKAFRHKNIIGLELLAQDDDAFYIVEEFGGDDLHLLLSRGLDVCRKKAIFREIVDGVAYLHDRGYCHLDLSPENFVVGKSTGQVKIIDFGVAQKLELDEARPIEVRLEAAAGKIQYMAPEVFTNTGPYSGLKADVWSLGRTLLVMLGPQDCLWESPRAGDPKFDALNAEGVVPGLAGFCKPPGLRSLSGATLEILTGALKCNANKRFFSSQLLEHVNEDEWLFDSEARESAEALSTGNRMDLVQAFVHLGREVQALRPDSSGRQARVRHISVLPMNAHAATDDERAELYTILLVQEHNDLVHDCLDNCLEVKEEVDALGWTPSWEFIVAEALRESDPSAGLSRTCSHERLPVKREIRRGDVVMGHAVEEGDFTNHKLPANLRMTAIRVDFLLGAAVIKSFGDRLTLPADCEGRHLARLQKLSFSWPMEPNGQASATPASSVDAMLPLVEGMQRMVDVIRAGGGESAAAQVSNEVDSLLGGIKLDEGSAYQWACAPPHGE